MPHTSEKKDVFADRVIAVVKKIPKGKVMSYGAVAKKAGARGAARAVGSVMAKNQSKAVPCHRVVAQTGKIGHYNGLLGDKARVLRREGVTFSKSGIIERRLFIK